MEPADVAAWPKTLNVPCHATPTHRYCCCCYRTHHHQHQAKNEWLRARIMRALGVLIEERDRDKAERILAAALTGGNGE